MRAIHGAILDIMGVMNRPDRDERMVEAAGIDLDRALFPLLVLTGRYGPIGVVELADRVGRDYTTVSRQIGKLEALGLAERRAGRQDRRVREAFLSEEGRAMLARIDTTRDRFMAALFSGWSDADVADFERMLCLFADAIRDGTPEAT
ncbi:MarR family transcriptional regulator [Martelella alba]|uniref:MarR family transcriptional regulator n=2 Tax=Martelella alba TaxID=2590451 RepID=A0A506U9M9_9HYPH|nr:MarR family transcriptional regulator [Martelella alba]